MIIENMIQTDEVKRIREVIENIDVVECTKTFSKYIIKCTDDEKSLGAIEKKFFNILYDNLSELVYESIMVGITDDNYKTHLKDYIVNGFWGISERELDDTLDVMCYTSDKDNHPLIQKYMNDALDKVVEDSNKETLSTNKKEIETIKKAIESNLKGIEELKKRLEVLEA